MKDMISVIIPFYNEKDNIAVLTAGVVEELDRFNRPYELVLVDDGSNDMGYEKIKKSEKIKLVRHKRKLGKGQALRTGIDQSSGGIIIFMDGDLQDDPKDIRKMVMKIDKGFDLVNGVRVLRHQDNPLLGSYSFLAEKFLKLFLSSPYSDINCGIKAFRRTVLSDFVFYGNNFRFFPLGVFYAGFKVTEIPVNNRIRLHGKSKFGPEKLVYGIFDTVTAYFIYKFSEKPLHFFGPVGLILFIAGFFISFYLTVQKVMFDVHLSDRPLLWLGVLLIIVGIQVAMTGILGELILFLNKKEKNN